MLSNKKNYVFVHVFMSKNTIFAYYNQTYSSIAQLVEHRTVNSAAIGKPPKFP